MKNEEFEQKVQLYLTVLRTESARIKDARQKYLDNLVGIFNFELGDDLETLVECENERFNRAMATYAPGGFPEYDPRHETYKRAQEIFEQEQDGYFFEEGTTNHNKRPKRKKLKSINDIKPNAKKRITTRGRGRCSL